MFEDKDILDGCLKNDRKAQELLYNKYASLLLGVLIRYAHHKAEAEDILQETFLKIFRHIDQFRGESSLYSWMKKVAVNTALRMLQTEPGFSVNQPLTDDLHDKESRDGEYRFTAEEMIKVIHSLPAGFRTIFNLYAIEGYKHKEIANMLGISENTSKSQYSRAKKYLQNALFKDTDIPDLITLVIF